MNLTTATPVEIDTALAEIHGRRYAAQDRADLVWRSVESQAKDVLGLRYRDAITREQVRDVCAEAVESREAGERLSYNQRSLLRSVDEYEHLQDVITDSYADEQPLDEEYHRRGCWTRAFLVTNTNGHVHRHMHCSTCFPTTRYHWMVEYSGKNEVEIVEAAGERACTVCYPSAPVSVLSRPTRMFTPDEIKAQQAREERAAKKAAADALKVIVPDFPTRKIRPERIEPSVKEFKTVRAAMQAAVDARYDAIWRGRLPHLADEAAQDVQVAESIERALAEKTGRTLADIQNETTTKGQKKAEKNWG